MKWRGLSNYVLSGFMSLCKITRGRFLTLDKQAAGPAQVPIHPASVQARRVWKFRKTRISLILEVLMDSDLGGVIAINRHLLQYHEKVL